jgi:hypothetical protein
MVGKHDPAGAHADALCAGGDMGNHDRRGGAGYTRHVVMLGYPEASIPPLFGMSGEIAGVVECTPSIRAFGHSDQIED